MNLPNKLTLLRIILVPFFMGFALLGGYGPADYTPAFYLAAGILFAAASFTDFLDGHLARKWHMVTDFGKFADPLADKMLVMTAFVILVEMGKAPAWVVAIIVCRELAITGLRLLIVENDGTVMAAAYPGKIKTTTQMLSIILLFLNNVFFNNIHVPMAGILLYVCLFFTIYSGIDYFVQNRSVFSDGFK